MVTVEEFKTAIRQVGSDPAFDHYILDLIEWASAKLEALTTDDPSAIPARKQACIALASYVFDRPGGGEGVKFANAFVNSGARAIVSEWLRPQTAMLDAADTPPMAPANVAPAPVVPAHQFYWGWDHEPRPTTLSWLTVGKVASDGTFEVPHPRIVGNLYWSIWRPPEVARLVSAVIVDPPMDLLNRATAAQPYVLHERDGHFRRSMARVNPATLAGRTVRLIYATA